MRTRPILIVLLLLVVSIFQPSIGEAASGSATDALGSTWDGLGRHAAGRSVLQENNTTAPPPSFAELVPIIIFVLAGVGIAIVVVAAGLWIAGRRRRGKGPEGGNPGGGGEGEKGENDEWGAKW